MPVLAEGSVFEGWLWETVRAGDFWRNVVATGIGVGLAFGLDRVIEWVAGRRRRAAERRLLVEGLKRNAIALARMASILEEGELPSQRLYVGHVSEAVLAWVQSHGGSTAYGQIVNVAHSIEHLNHRMDFVALNETSERLVERLGGKRQPLEPYIRETAQLVAAIGGFVLGLLESLGTAEDRKEVEGAMQRLASALKKAERVSD